MLFNLINYAQFERKQTAERIVANFTARAYRGLWNGGNLPLGYRRSTDRPGSLEVDDTEAEKLRTIFRVFLKTKNLHATCRTLTEMGIRTKTYKNRKGEEKGGNLLTVQSLHHVLTNATVLGLREINKKRGNHERVKAFWPAILDAKTFEAVQKRLEANRRRFKPNEWKRYPYPLTGIASCGECGLALNGKSAHGKTKRHHYYDHPRTLKSFENGHIHKCESQRHRAEKIEDEVMGSLKRILSEPIRIEQAIASYRRSQNMDAPRISREITRATEDVKANQRKIKNLVDRIAELPATPIYERIKELQGKVVEQEKAILLLEKEKGNYAVGDVSQETLRTTILETIRRLEQAPKEQQRDIFENVLQFAEFHPKNRLRLGVYAESTPRNAKIRAAHGGDSGSVAVLGSRFGCSRTFKVGGFFAPAVIPQV